MDQGHERGPVRSGLTRRGPSCSRDSTAGVGLELLHVDEGTLTPDAVAERIDRGAGIFARSTPEQKMRIVRALERRQKIVAMTGDGVNDAPPLEAADVGIAMGASGTEVARESAQIILLDDDFASIVAGIEEGRTVFVNIEKSTNYVLVSNGPEILPYLLFILLPVPLAPTVIQILSIDLGTDIIPSMALGQEPPEEDTMKRAPRRSGDALRSWPILAHSYLFLGPIEPIWSYALFFPVLDRGGWPYGDPILDAKDPLTQSATGIALSTILPMQIGDLIGRRNRDRSGLGTKPVEPWIHALASLGVPRIFLSDLARRRVEGWLRGRGAQSGWRIA